MRVLAMRLRAPLALVLIALLLGACTGGGVGSREPTESEIGEAQDAERRDEQALADTVEQAFAGLEAAVAAVDPCEPTDAQLASVLSQLSILQGAGVDTPALTTRAMGSLAPVVQSIARAQANGLVDGMSTETLVALARAAGLDPDRPDWMGDPECADRWRLSVEWSQSLPGPIAISLTFRGSTEFLASDGGGFASTPGPITFEGSGGAASNACTFTFRGGEGQFSAAGAHFLPEDEFRMDTMWDDIPYTAVLQCPGIAPIELPATMSGLTMPVTLPANDGATLTVPFTGLGGQAVYTLQQVDRAGRR